MASGIDETLDTDAFVEDAQYQKLADKGAVSLAQPVMDAMTERAVRTFMRRLEGKYLLIAAILFGSRARGAHTAESDADIAVVLQGARGDRFAVGGDMAGIAFDVMLETGVLVEALPLWADELDQPNTFSNPALILNILRDGVWL
jgi:hypothetical protein